MSEQQRLHKIIFERIKGLKNMTFNLGDKNVTGIFGPNGSGKSTILYILLCLYKPKSERVNYRYSNFFISDDTNNWVGSKFSYEGSYSIDGKKKTFSREVHKKKNRWLHDYGERPDRDVYFIGIDSCVPDVEIEKSENIHLDSTEAINKADEIRKIASDIMNFDYGMFQYRKNSKKKYINCKKGDLEYISLSMGAGEQRLFKILEIVVNAPKYSMIIIDEIDLTLHSRALSKLINHIVRIAELNNLQIIFTSHRQELINRDDINIRHLLPPFKSDGDTICMEQTTSECVERLTGDAERPIEIFVEDDLAQAIVEQIAAEEGIKSKVSIKKYGDIVLS